MTWMEINCKIAVMSCPIPQGRLHPVPPPAVQLQFTCTSPPSGHNSKGILRLLKIFPPGVPDSFCLQEWDFAINIIAQNIVLLIVHCSLWI